MNSSSASSDLQSSISNPYLFQGRRYDFETGFYYFRNRYYDPRAGRFLQRDPVWDEQNVGGWYAFVGNGPLSRWDPRGMNGKSAPSFCLDDVDVSDLELAEKTIESKIRLLVTELNMVAHDAIGAEWKGKVRDAGMFGNSDLIKYTIQIVGNFLAKKLGKTLAQPGQVSPAIILADLAKTLGDLYVTHRELGAIGDQIRSEYENLQAILREKRRRFEAARERHCEALEAHQAASELKKRKTEERLREQERERRKEEELRKAGLDEASQAQLDFADFFTRPFGADDPAAGRRGSPVPAESSRLSSKPLWPRLDPAKPGTGGGGVEEVIH